MNKHLIRGFNDELSKIAGLTDALAAVSPIGGALKGAKQLLGKPKLPGGQKLIGPPKVRPPYLRR